MQQQRQAIVIGGSIAGLLAARVLTEHFDHVILIERDNYPDTPDFRPGVPQGRHVHVLLLRGQQELEKLFPGITAKLLAQGAISYDPGRELYFRYPSGWLPRSRSSIIGYTCTRLLIEWQIHQELLKDEHITFLESHEVVGLLADENAYRVNGVRTRKRDITIHVEGVQEELLADLVVDASGRESHAPRWLQELGYLPPEETEINAFLGYATRTYALPSDEERDWRGLVVMHDVPRNLRGGLIWEVEGGRWMVVLAGSGRDYPPTDEEGFTDFMRSLVDPMVYEEIKKTHPLTPIYGYRRTTNRFRHFERLQHRPERFVVLGDAFCAFNPIYGQGMTVAALGAITLRDTLRQRKHKLDGLASIFSKRLAQVTKLPWQLATSSDDTILRAIGENRKVSSVTRIVNTYFQGLGDIMPSSPLAARTFSEVQNMVKSPLALFHPFLIWQVLMYKRGHA